ncbi:MAG TPA: hypothetical protein VK203_27750 [Nostocaceae cyanobacterium]|nr:hypothetical protein [Nostocaceae cyanobacterium]
MTKVVPLFDDFSEDYNSSRQELPTALERYLKLKAAIAQLEVEAESVRPDAEILALDALAKIPDAQKARKTVLQNESGKIVVQFRKVYPKIKDDVELTRLEEDINRIQGKLYQKNLPKIEQIDSEITSLQEMINKLEAEKGELTNNKQLVSLKKRRSDRQESLITLKPVLAIYLSRQSP